MSSQPNPLKMFSPKGRNVGLSQATGDGADAGMGKESSEQAGYMELEGAQKDADCTKVQVEGGVSSDLGCCNDYQPQEKAQEFKCGMCTFVTAAQGGSSPDATGNSQPVVSGSPS